MIWERLIGHDNLRDFLPKAAAQPSSSYLFFGPPGVGKVAAARLFAAAILCPDQCGECSTCLRALKGAHPDVHWFQPEGAIYTVESIRELVASAFLTPMEGRRRVIVIEEADRIIERSQNALLKALEEPGRALTWILVADALDTLLPTILSRCQVVEFSGIAEDTISAILRSSFELSDEEVSKIVRSVRGDLDRAVALAADEKARSIRALALDAATQREPSTAWALDLATRVQELAWSVRAELEESQAAELAALQDVMTTSGWKRRSGDRHRRAQRAAETEVFTGFLVWLGTAFRDLAAISAGSSASSAVALDRAADLVSAAPQRSTAFWLDMADAALDAQLAVRENANAGLVVEALLLRLASDRESVGAGYTS